MIHHGRAETDCLFLPYTPGTDPENIVSGRSASGYNLALVRGDIRMSLNIAGSRYRYGKIIIILERKIMNEPCTESQKESEQQNCPVSPT